MRKTLLLATLTLLAACGSDSSENSGTPAIIGTGQGIDSGEITAKGNLESIAPITGALTISDPDEGQGAFIEQSNVQGVFGQFSLSASGEWSYTLTDLATDYNLTPEDTFTVSSKDGTEHQVKVLVKGLYQRESLSGEYSKPIEIPFDVYDFGGNLVSPISYQYGLHSDYDIYDSSGYYINEEDYQEKIAVAELFDTGQLQLMIANLRSKNVETYNELDIHTGSSYFYSSSTESESKYTYQYDEYGNESITSLFDDYYSVTEPFKTYSYQNNYVDGVLTSRLEEENRYTITSNFDITLSRTIYRQQTINEGLSLSNSYDSYNYQYDPYSILSLTYDYEFNGLGQKTAYFATYNIDDIEEALAGPRLRGQYFYNANGDLDYELNYRTSSGTLYEGVRNKSEYYYDEYNRLSYRARYYSDVEYIENVGVYGDLDLTKPYYIVYIYNDELNLEINFSLNTYFNGVLIQNEVEEIAFTQFEDVDYCDGTPASNCRIKQAASSTASMPLL